MQLVSEARIVLETVPSNLTVGPDASQLVSEVTFARVTLTHGNIWFKERGDDGVEGDGPVVPRGPQGSQGAELELCCT